MTIFYFPGCKYSARSPESSARLTAYLAGRFGAVAAGCCSADHARLARGEPIESIAIDYGSAEERRHA